MSETPVQSCWEEIGPKVFNNWLTQLTLFCRHRDIVDQSSRAQPPSGKQTAGSCRIGLFGQCLSVDQRNIVDHEAGGGQAFARRSNGFVGRHAPVQRARCVAQRAWQGNRAGAFGIIKIDITRRQGEAIIIALGRHTDNLHRQVKVSNEAANHGQLLIILLTKIGGVRHNLLKKLGNDRRDAIKMARPRQAVEPLTDASHRDIGGKAFWIHCFNRRQPQHITPGISQHPRVGLFPAWIAAKILVRAKLFRVDEDRGNDARRGAPCRLDKRDMAGMKRPHGRHEGHLRTLGAEGGNSATQFGNGTDDQHGMKLTLRQGRAGLLWGGGITINMGCDELMGAAKPHVIVFANEKGGTGKSTTAVHVAIALQVRGARVAALDLDHRQRTLGRYLDNRQATQKRVARELSIPRHATHDGTSLENFEARFAEFSVDTDYLVIDTPGRDDPFARLAAQRADTLVTPMNDSFVDFDLIGQVDPDTYKVTRPSFYAELIWDARKARAKADGSTIDWVVLRNRVQHVEARNMRRVSEALDQLAKRVGFRIIPGLGERVIYRELFPKGLTMLDSAEFGGMGLAHVAARQELREMMSALALPEPALPLFAA